MKRMILCVSILVGLGLSASAQAKKQTTAKKQPVAKTTTAKKSTAKKNSTPKATAASKKKTAADNKPATTASVNSTSDRTYILSNSTSHSAYLAPSAGTTLQISDPVVRTLNARANGANIRVSGSGVIGMPRGSFGFANGHITLMPSGARTSGTQTGSGATATGTSPGSAGSFGPAMGLNGKSPYEGPGLWSSAHPFTLRDTLTSKGNRNRR
jgi:hypothetical protein